MHSLVVGYLMDKKFVVHHMVVYKDKPSKADEDSLREELRNDEQFELNSYIDEMDIMYIEFMDN
jgi:hypothetical protein